MDHHVTRELTVTAAAVHDRLLHLDAVQCGAPLRVVVPIAALRWWEERFDRDEAVLHLADGAQITVRFEPASGDAGDTAAYGAAQLAALTQELTAHMAAAVDPPASMATAVFGPPLLVPDLPS